MMERLADSLDHHKSKCTYSNLSQLCHICGSTGGSHNRLHGSVGDVLITNELPR